MSESDREVFMDAGSFPEGKLRRRVRPKGSLVPRVLRPDRRANMAAEEAGEVSGLAPGDDNVDLEETLG